MVDFSQCFLDFVIKPEKNTVTCKTLLFIASLIEYENYLVNAANYYIC